MRDVLYGHDHENHRASRSSRHGTEGTAQRPEGAVANGSAMTCETCKKNLTVIRYNGRHLCSPCYMKTFPAELEVQDAVERTPALPASEFPKEQDQ